MPLSSDLGATTGGHGTPPADAGAPNAAAGDGPSSVPAAAPRFPGDIRAYEAWLAEGGTPEQIAHLDAIIARKDANNREIGAFEHSAPAPKPTPAQELDWHEWRRGGIGGSDIAAIVGLSPWASPWSVWADKVGLRTPEPASSVMEFGKRFEPVGVRWFEDKRPGLFVAGEQTWCTHKTYKWARCTVDGFVTETPDPIGAPVPFMEELLGAYEGKCDFHHGADAWAEQIPPHYQCQAQWQLFVTGLERTWFGVLHPFGRYEVYELARDEADIALLHKAAEAFWLEHVVPGIPPEVDASEATADAIANAWPEHLSGKRVDLSGLALVFAARAELMDQAKALQELIDAHDNVIAAAIKDAEIVEIDGVPAWTYKAQDRRGINREALVADLPDIAEKYGTKTTYRVLRAAPKSRKKDS